MILAVEQTTWDLIGQIAVWFVGFPALVIGLLVYIAVQIRNERIENQRFEGRWGLKATKNTDE